MKLLKSLCLIGPALVFAACSGGGDGGADATTDAMMGDQVSGCTENDQQDCKTAKGYAGIQVCLNGKWSECTPECNDGDQGSCNTVCGSKGSHTCTGGEWGQCQAPAETCNGADDDCDGSTDEDLGQETCGKGECQHSADKCVGGVMQGCNPFEGATAETCDGKDNNCDGAIDENLLQECQTKCGNGIEKCVGGQWKDCSAPPELAEECDGKDNNCDGQTDEGLDCSCNTGDATACGTDEGECVPGVKNCVAGKWGPCGGNDYVEPVAESCNNKDDDCDGETDEGLVQDCQTDCGNGKEVCDAGSWVNCTAPAPADETCDLVDNDCDGTTDEDQSADQYENNEECAMARDLGDAEEDAGAVAFKANLYPSGDVDWFKIMAKEVSDLIPPCDLKNDPCYVFDLSLAGIPDGADYDLAANAGDCDGTMGKFTSDDGTGSEQLQIVWKGTWFVDDSTEFFVKVAPKTDSFSCLEYDLTADFWGTCPDPDTGKCPWE